MQVASIIEVLARGAAADVEVNERRRQHLRLLRSDRIVKDIAYDVLEVALLNVFQHIGADNAVEKPLRSGSEMIDTRVVTMRQDATPGLVDAVGQVLITLARTIVKEARRLA